MTTKVTVETHNWPVAVTIFDSHNYTTPTQRSNEYTEREEFIPANAKREYHITDSRRISFVELQKDATCLPNYMLADCVSASGSNTSIEPHVAADTVEEPVVPGDEVAGDGA